MVHLKLAQKSAIFLGYFCQELSKFAQSGHTDQGHVDTFLRSFIIQCLVVFSQSSTIKSFAPINFKSSSEHIKCTVTHNQCDQITLLFFHCMAITNHQNLPNSIFFAKVGSKFCQMLTRPYKKWQILLKFCPNGEILPNLATLPAKPKWGSIL